MTEGPPAQVILPDFIEKESSVAAPTVSATPPQRETPSPASTAAAVAVPAPPERKFLIAIGETRLYVSTGGGRPLDLPMDALVISADYQANLAGALGNHVRSVIPDSWPAFESGVRTTLKDRSLSPDGPVFVPIRPSKRPPLTLIAATPWVLQAEHGTLDGVEQAVRAVIEKSQRHRLRRVVIPLLGARGGGLDPIQVARSILVAAQTALPANPGIQELTVLSPEEDAYKELLAFYTRVPQRFANDLAGGEDLLDVASEVQALTDILLLRSLEPPLAVGILGGWGSGKSFVMDLMLRHIQRIRGLSLENGWGEGAGLYVGHIYPITFDAWTYAKSNLWASLMQTIFIELSRQIHLERRIREHLADVEDPELEGRLWLAFQKVNERDRKALLEQEGLAEHFNALSSPSKHLDSEAGKALWESVAKLKEEQQKVLEKKQKDLADISRQIEQKRADLETQVDQELESKAYEIAWERLSEALKPVITEALAATEGSARVARSGSDIKDFLRLIGSDAAAVPLRLRNFWQMVRRNPVVAVAAGLTFAALPVLGLWLQSHQADLAAGMAWVASILAPLAGVLGTARSWRNQVASVWSGLEREVRSSEFRVEREREALLQEKLASPQTADDLQKLDERKRQLDAEILRLRQQIGFTADYVSVADLVQARLCKAEYEGELGLLHRVQCDLEELSNALCLPEGHPHSDKLREQFPRGRARIVLFIDDLDRCPPDRVVEVLEAVQLLVKTPLFVVVLAMDVRYITRALEKVYKDILLRNGKPCGLDYIEKIIQLPYSVRPIDATSFERFLRGQMEVAAVQEDGGEGDPVEASARGAMTDGTSSTESTIEEPEPITSEVVTFSVDELQWVKRCCENLPLSPRAVKRVVNALKLLKIVWSRPNRHRQPDLEVEKAFVALVALSAAYPNGMRLLFGSLSRRVQEASSSLVLHKLITDLLPLFSERCSEEEIAGLSRGVGLISRQALIDSSVWPTLELVRSLSFVAEIGYDPADERQEVSVG